MAESYGRTTGKRKSIPRKTVKVKIVDAPMFKVADVSHSEMVENLRAASKYGLGPTPIYLPSLTAANCVFLEKEKLYAFGNRSSSTGMCKSNTFEYIRMIAECILPIHQNYLLTNEIFIPMDIRTVFYLVKDACQHPAADPLPIPSISTIRNLINSLCCLFECTRSSFGVMSDNSKSLFFGNVIVTRQGFNSSFHTKDISSCSEPQTAYNYNLVTVEPTLVKPPEFILVVEKKTVFSQLLDAKFHYKYPCVVITGSGYPTCECRQFVRFIQQKLKLRVFMFVDFNPHGFDIFRTYKYGSKKLCFMSPNLVTPSMELIGLFISDFKTGFMDGMATFNPTDLRKYKSLASEGWLRGWLCCESDLKDSFNFFESNQLKADMEHFIYHSRNSWYIANNLLADKFRTLCVSPSTRDKMEELEFLESGVNNVMFDNLLVPQSMRGFIRHHHAIVGDGHCGFRSIAFSFYGNQEKWPKVRFDLLDELKVHRDMLGITYEEQHQKLNCFEKLVGEYYYLEIDALGLVVATVYQRVVVCLSGPKSVTFLPLRLTKFDLSAITTAPKIAMLLDGIHFSVLELDDEAPLPTLHPSWVLYRNDEVEPLEEHYREYFQKFIPHRVPT